MSRPFKRGKRSDYPPLKIQFEEGQRAFYNGKLKNPYPASQMRNKEWERGFNSAYFKSKNRFKRRRYAK
jgi:hypothetical protein